MRKERERPAQGLIEQVVRRLELVVQTRGIAQAIAAFYDDEEVFAGRTFLGLSSSLQNRIEESDLLAVTLMGEWFRPRAVRQLLYEKEGRRASDYLERIDPAMPLWERDIDAMHRSGDAVFDLWHLLLKLTDVGYTRASKLMARKRPNVVPIFDSVVSERIATAWDYWYVFHAFFADHGGHDQVAHLRSESGLDDVPLLRVLDTAVWILYSGGRSARRVREECGLPPSPEAI